MTQLKTEGFLESALKELKNIISSEKLKAFENNYFGKKGKLTDLLKEIKNLNEEEKKILGPILQNIKTTLIKELQKKQEEMEKQEIDNKLNETFFDITFPDIGKPLPRKRGSIHALSTLQKEVEDIFSDMGFEIADGPEVESEFYNFEALNIPKNHPARDMQDTFFIENNDCPKEGKLLLRTHTSPVQIRTMRQKGAPLRIIVPGRVFRYEATDATHDSTFNQVEGLLIDKNINLSTLKGVATEFLSRLFKKELTIRFRPGYFPFVEPGIELDLLWKKGTNGNPDKWLEFMGAGMVHPNVLKAGGIDPQKNSGWAFGFGLTRLAMIKYGISDIRYLHSNDLRFLKQL